MQDFNPRQNANANDWRRLHTGQGQVAAGYYDVQNNPAQAAHMQAQQRYQQASQGLPYNNAPQYQPQPQPQQMQLQPQQQPVPQNYPPYAQQPMQPQSPYGYPGFPGYPGYDNGMMTGMMVPMGGEKKKKKKDKKKKKKRKEHKQQAPVQLHLTNVQPTANPHNLTNNDLLSTPEHPPHHSSMMDDGRDDGSDDSSVSGIDDVIFRQLQREQQLQPPGAREDEFPTEKFQRRVEKLIEVPVERMVKVPVVVQEEVTTVEKRKVPRKKIIEEPDWKIVKEPYTKIVPREKTRMKEIWVKQLVPETYTVNQVKHCTREVKVPTTKVKEIDTFEEVEVPVRKVVDVHSYRIDKVLDKKVVKVEGVQEFDLVPREGAFQVDKAKAVHRYPAVERIMGREAYRADPADLDWIQTDEDDHKTEVHRTHEPYWPTAMPGTQSHRTPPRRSRSPKPHHSSNVAVPAQPPMRSHSATPTSLSTNSPRQRVSYWS
eukprot:TRINITY_DN50691_c0_g1_i1.p1 TRINITY_DN50691_c0_g1~~TRINITY_DN50691_c0_g1_i1.p1  ORF type:complete len:485 (+),score=69.42 TRINITY_DN50691_c0_g1_i1:89-1543(+)